jgi:hypothetical protein
VPDGVAGDLISKPQGWYRVSIFCSSGGGVIVSKVFVTFKPYSLVRVEGCGLKVSSKSSLASLTTISQGHLSLGQRAIIYMSRQ